MLLYIWYFLTGNYLNTAYQVGSDLGWHGNFTFKTPPQGHDWVVNVALYGDHGLVQGNIVRNCCFSFIFNKCSVSRIILRSRNHS